MEEFTFSQESVGLPTLPLDKMGSLHKAGFACQKRSCRRKNAEHTVHGWRRACD